MISKKYIQDSMVVSIVQFKNQKTNKPVFYLACAVPVRIRWANNKCEIIDLLDRVEIKMKFLSRLKFLVGKALTVREAEKNMSRDRLIELVNKTYANMKDREELGYIPNRLKDEKLYFKNIYEVTKKRNS